ncbi:MAG: hypothetical protein FJW96_02800 [Actinobacteria bacterium]|nr:hypothetical protein [Actinomycetota bacterium]
MRQDGGTNEGTRANALWGGGKRVRIALGGTLLVLVAAVAALATPHRGTASGADAYVPDALAAAAKSEQTKTFKVIVQSRSGGAAKAESAVTDAMRQKPGKAKGSKKRFSSLPAVAAELTGDQIEELADDPGVLAITPDVEIVPTYSNSQKWVPSTELLELKTNA